MTSSPAGSLRSSIRRIRQVEELGVVTALIVLGLLLTFATEHFADPSNLLEVARSASFTAIIAVGTVFVLAAGEIDMSIGPNYVLTMVITAIALQQGLPPVAVMPIGLATGIALGLFNGALSIGLRIPTVIISLGTLSVFKGMALVVTDASAVSRFPKDNFYFEVIGGSVGPVPTSVIVMLAVGVAGHILLVQTPFGRRVRSIGANRTAARLSGVDVERTKLAALGVQGFFCGVAALVSLAYLQGVDPIMGANTTLAVIAAVIIGGTSIAGGSGTVIGALVGSLIIIVVTNGLVHLGVSPFWQNTVTGGLIIAAVAVDYVVKRRR